MKKALIWVLAVIIIILAGVLGYMAYLLGTQSTQKTESTATITAVQTTSETKTTTVATSAETLAPTTAVPVATATVKAGTTKYYVTAVEGLRLREGPSTTDKIIVLMPFGAEFLADSETNGWLHGMYAEHLGAFDGYCSKDYVSTTNPTANWTTYTNSKYGFSIKLPWSDYTVDTKIYDGITEDIRFWIPTTDSSWPEYPKYNLFVITIYTSAQWDAAKAAGGPISTLLANKSWVYGFSNAQATPSDGQAKFDMLSQVRATFKLI